MDRNTLRARGSAFCSLPARPKLTNLRVGILNNYSDDRDVIGSNTGRREISTNAPSKFFSAFVQLRHARGVQITSENVVDAIWGILRPYTHDQASIQTHYERNESETLNFSRRPLASPRCKNSSEPPIRELDAFPRWTDHNLRPPEPPFEFVPVHQSTAQLIYSLRAFSKIHAIF